MTETKACTKCGEAKTLDQFYTDKKSPDGLQSDCKACRTAATARRYHERKSDPEWRAKHNASARASRGRNVSVYLWGNANQRSIKNGTPFSITPADVVVPDYCPVLGVRLERGTGRGGSDTSPSLDRKVPSLGYVPGNVVVVSNLANRIKTNATAAEVRAVLAWMEAEGLA